ncbi:spore germination protein [Clostridium sp. 'White wine YQ']|uniref:spore germination protein n=1 Tax=Clostridium sp. 'White wine YQ' TaxID=3027474 RepID=UPI0023669B4A|nr:spore germination protein [Clostridium sp. 'White wine YQ']MDD7795881.1 spore germination protein [Clostridium sp. 'White wine YQ']
MNKINDIKDWLDVQLCNSADAEFRTLNYNKKKAYICFISSICDLENIMKTLITPFFNMTSYENFQNYLISLPKCTISTDKNFILNKILHGSVAILLENDIYIFEAKKFMESDISDSSSETVTQGPKDSLQENIETNLNLIRNRYNQKYLTVEQHMLGVENIPSVILYNNQLVDYKILDELNKKIDEFYVKSINSVQKIHKDFMKKNSILFPTIMVVDRTDRIIKNIEDGKIIMLVQGNPYALILPSVFFDFMTSMDDYYQLPAVGTFLLILRYISAFLVISLPGLYVGSTSYNPEIFRYEFAISIATSRVDLPYQSFLEVLFMLIIMELLLNSSTNLPKGTGSVATTVGGLILGQSAVAAGLATNIMVIIISTIIISYYILPANSINRAISLSKYIVLIFSVFYGLIGVIIGFIVIIFYLASIRSFGKPYLQLFFSKNKT